MHIFNFSCKISATSPPPPTNTEQNQWEPDWSSVSAGASVTTNLLNFSDFYVHVAVDFQPWLGFEKGVLPEKRHL